MKPYYEHAGVTIYHGDCRGVLPMLEPVDLVLADPPYAISTAGVVHRGSKGKGSRRFDFFPGDSDWESQTAAVVQSLALAAEKVTSLYAWLGHRQFGPVVTHLEAAGFKTRFLVWEKKAPCPPPPRAGWPSGAELCVYAYKAGRTWTHRGKNTPRSNVLLADSYRHGQPGKVDHPTQKPPQVIAPLIQASSMPGDWVVDPFMGSGTTLVVAKALGRKAIGIEIEERYCEIAANRLRQEVLAL